MKTSRICNWSGAGAVATAGGFALSWLCCIPLLAGGLGVAAAGAATAVAPLRPYLGAAALIFLGIGFWQTYGHSSCTEGSACESPRTRRRWFLWLTALISLLLLTLPQWSSWVIYWFL